MVIYHYDERNLKIVYDGRLVRIVMQVVGSACAEAGVGGQSASGHAR